MVIGTNIGFSGSYFLKKKYTVVKSSLWYPANSVGKNLYTMTIAVRVIRHLNVD